MAKLTPMMERYMQVKRENPGSMLLFRMGDFYELFHQDAEEASRALGLTLTSRDKASDNPVPMAGFPYHQLDNYLQKLITGGYRVAICDQVEDPKKAKGMVRREVTRVVTPGTLTDDELLDPQSCNFIACVFPGRRFVGLAWLEVSTGRFCVADVEPNSLADELARVRPSECLVPESDDEGDGDSLRRQIGESAVMTARPVWSFAREDCVRRLRQHFEVKTLEGFDLEETSDGVVAAGALLEYVEETQRAALGHITRLECWNRTDHLQVDAATRRSLELTHTMRDGSRHGSLLAVIDETSTSMGARLLAEWLNAPLTSGDAIRARLDAVEELCGDVGLRDTVRLQLKQIQDLQRLTTRVATGRCSPRDLCGLTRSLASLPKLRAAISARRAALLQELEERVDLCSDVRESIEARLVDDPPNTVSDGNVIRAGFDSRLDELRELARGGKQWIAAYQAEESEKTGIPNLKIGFNKVFGYYLEVTAAHKDKVPDRYIRKQTLKNQERYITPELKEYEDKVLHAEEQANELEQEIFNGLKERLLNHVPRLLKTADAIAETDVLAGLSELAASASYCRPEVTDEPVLDIREGRHPVLDRLQPSGTFVPNDVRLNLENSEDNGKLLAGRIQLITGPNMAGKSTYIRQAALITIMAQIGSFVPASEARIGIADRVFARVGASDELGKGQSTFMVEMTETARILNSATNRSVVILDEIGRGTSTYDGISLAWAITEFLHDEAHCRTMFATHYHELTELSRTLKHASNWNVAVKEQDETIVFLHRIVEGAADRSYGIHVAKLAGVPRSVTERAETILETLETDHLDSDGRPKVPKRKHNTRQQLSLFAPPEDPIRGEIRNLKIDDMSPRDALAELYRLHEQAGKKD